MKAEVWLTTGEAAALAGISIRAVQKKVSSGEWASREEKVASGGGRGGVGYLVALSSLPTPARQKYLRQSKASRANLALAGAPEECPADETAPVEDVAAQEAPAGGSAGSGGGAAARRPVNPAEVKALVGEEKFQELLAEAEHKAAAAREALALPENRRKTKLMGVIADRYGITKSSLYRYVEMYQEGGTIALMRKLPRLGVGTVRRSIDETQEAFARREYLQLGKPKAAHVYRKLKRFCEKLGLKCCSQATFFRYIEDMEKYEPDLVCLARDGEEEYMKKFAVKATRKEPERANEVWEGDHHKLDAFIEYNGRPVRPWLTIWLDVCSRVVVGWAISIQANGRTIALATRYGILPKAKSGWDRPVSKAMAKALESLYWEKEELAASAGEPLPCSGLPKALYIDNGEDYKSKLKKGVKHEGWEYSREMRSTCELLGIQALFCTKYSPWAKGHCERWFGTFTSQFTRYLPGYCGKDGKERPEGLDEKTMAERDELLDLEELCKLIEMYLEIYHNTVHSSLGMTPYEKYLSTPKAREEMPDVRTLDICLMDVEKAKVTASGIQRFGTRGRRRWYKHEALDGMAGQWAVIRYDPNRIGEILVFSAKTGEYICTATNDQLLSWGASKKDIEQHCKRRASRKKELKQRLKEIRVELPEEIAQREAAGAVMATGANVEEKPAVPMLTGMEKAARARGKAGGKPQRPAGGQAARAKKTSRFDEYIRNAGNK